MPGDDGSWTRVNLRPAEAKKFGNFAVQEHNKNSTTKLQYARVNDTTVMHKRIAGVDEHLYTFTVYAKPNAQQEVSYTVTLKDKRPDNNSCDTLELIKFE